MDISTNRYFHVDVFARRALTGNGLSVFLPCDGWSESSLRQLTLEMRQFESIFLCAIDAHGASARIFTMQEELPFAGHPVLGAAAVLHRVLVPDEERHCWTLRLPARAVQVTTRGLAGAVFAEMDQGIAEFGDAIDAAQAADLLAALNLESGDLAQDLPLQVVSTGLPYLIVPVTATALDRSAVRGRELERLLARFGACFVYVLDPDTPEGRTWDNLGDVEDVATGSAAGPAAAYLYRHGRVASDRAIVLRQGRHAGRASELGARCVDGRVLVSGEVWPVISGALDAKPGRVLQSSAAK
jgi:PhzF family phenazine biosynthesis protein